MKDRRPIHAALLAVMLLTLVSINQIGAVEIEREDPARYPLPVTATPYAVVKPVDALSDAGWMESEERDVSELSLLLLSADLANATEAELRSRARFLGLPAEGDANSLRELLYRQYGLSEVQPAGQSVSGGKDFRLQILFADRMRVVRSGWELVLLEGNVAVLFLQKNDGSESELRADRMVLDTQRMRLSAMGSVRYRSERGSGIDTFEGSFLSLRWDDGGLSVTDGSTRMVRKNSEGDDVEFFISGSEVSLSGGRRTISLSDGLITTREENPYFSISADTMQVIEGGDLFVRNAWISLGRVPLVWIPFLYYPGKTFVFNPSFGFDTDRGVFFSTTTELYGVYPKITQDGQSSFTTLLATDTGETRRRDGWVYSTGGGVSEETPFRQWVEESGSYLALIADTYQTKGTFIGIDTLNKSVSRRCTLSVFGGLGFLGDSGASIESAYTIPPVRYLFDGIFDIDSPAIDFSLDAPFYSDPRVLRDYGNRLTSFSLGALAGNATFPDTYASDITSFTWAFAGSANIPTGVLRPFVESLRISNFSGKVVWKPLSANEGTGFAVSSAIIPDLNASVSGTLFSRTSGDPEGKDDGNGAAVPPEVPSADDFKPALDLHAFGIASPYRVVSAASAVPAEITGSSASLTYRISQIFTNGYAIEDSVATDASRYARTSGNITLSAALAPSVLRFAQRFDPILTVNSAQGSGTDRLSVASATDLSVPVLGLSYGLTAKIYGMTWNTIDGIADDPVGGWGGWDGESVSRHQISLSRPLQFSGSSLIPSVTAILPPLTFGIVPKLSFFSGGFSASASYRIEDDGTGVMIGDEAVFALKYSDPRILSFFAQATYDTSYTAHHAGFSWDPLDVETSGSLRLFDRYLTLEHAQRFSFSDRSFDLLSASVAVPWASVSFQGGGQWNDVALDILDAQVRVSGLEFNWWKDRIGLGVDLVSSYRHSFLDDASSGFSFKFALDFSIAEFITLDIALTSVNKGFYRYDDFSDMWEDLLRSFDFFGDGRRNTQFTMENIEISLIHHMPDWDLHCKYEGSVVLSNMEWLWRPVFSVYLQWKAIPEIKVDRRFERST